MCRSNRLLSLALRFGHRSAVFALRITLGVLPLDAAAAAPTGKPAKQPASQSAAAKKPAQPAPLSQVEVVDKISKVTKAIEALDAAQKQLDAYSDEMIDSAQKAQGAAVAKSIGAAADLVLESAPKFAPGPGAKKAELVNKAYKTARDHVTALFEADEAAATIAGLKAVSGDIEMITGVQVEPGGKVSQALLQAGSIAKLNAGINALDAKNKAEKAKVVESALATVRVATDMASALGNSKAVEPLKFATNLLSSAQKFATSLDNIGQATDLRADGQLLKTSMKQRIAEARVSLESKQIALSGQLPGPTIVYRQQYIPPQPIRLQIVQQPVFREVTTLRLVEAPKLEFVQMPKLEVVQAPKLEFVQVPGPFGTSMTTIEPAQPSKVDQFFQIAGAALSIYSAFSAANGSARSGQSPARSEIAPGQCVNPAAQQANAQMKVGAGIRNPDGSYIPWTVPCSALRKK